MKISVVTVCFNAATTIEHTLSSVASQSHRDVEHIVVDGASRDSTLDVIAKHGSHVAALISEPDRGLYDAMNKGMRAATGDVVAFLNADDMYTHSGVLARVASVMADPALDACYANLAYVDREHGTRVVRVWHSRDYRPGLFKRGWMPAHPTLFVRREVLNRTGGFDLEFRQQADFDLALRLFEFGELRSRFVPEYWVQMRAGGISNAGLGAVLRGNIEAWRICRKNKLDVPPWFVVTKVGSRLLQLMPWLTTRYRAVQVDAPQ